LKPLLDEIQQKRASLQDRYTFRKEQYTIPQMKENSLQIMRQQQIKESLFLYLLQKKKKQLFLLPLKFLISEFLSQLLAMVSSLLIEKSLFTY
jgi:hypothetical protein